jgi:hypothetical protein
MPKKPSPIERATAAEGKAQAAIAGLSEIQRGKKVLQLYAALHREAMHLDLCYRPLLTQLEGAAATQLINGTITDLLRPFSK